MVFSIFNLARSLLSLFLSGSQEINDIFDVYGKHRSLFLVESISGRYCQTGRPYDYNGVRLTDFHVFLLAWVELQYESLKRGDWTSIKRGAMYMQNGGYGNREFSRLYRGYIYSKCKYICMRADIQCSWQRQGRFRKSVETSFRLAKQDLFATVLAAFLWALYVKWPP